MRPICSVRASSVKLGINGNVRKPYLAGLSRGKRFLRGIGTAVVSCPANKGLVMLMALRNPRFWDMKVRIAILALATFMAMC
jgi:hypothetical protein